VLYRLSVHVADTDEQAIDDLLASGAAERRVGFSQSNRALDDTAANLGYYGRDVENQRGRLQPHDLNERIELGQLLVGSPPTVLNQVRTVRDALGCGILDLIFQPVGREKTLKAIELFGTDVLPRMRDL
jgi:alkanesulfonate monooxygenase SsuD/methylene tetrahydromethanopterin reductase-like flavin-dependent oxidoreductase (luciferase family)